MTRLARLAAISAAACLAGEGDATLRDFRFRNGERLDEIRIHYRSLGELRKDGSGRATNAVLILHGTGGSGESFVTREYFKGELFGPGQPLDTAKYFVVIPDNLGHGKSTKPSDGLRAKFPRYGYLDMVEAQRRMLEEALGVNRLRLILGTSMGCMHAWVWGTEHPGYADALMPLACLPHPITGRNLVWRQQVIDLLRSDPAYDSGNYTAPLAASKAVNYILYLMGQNPLQLQAKGPTREKALQVFEEHRKALRQTDPNDTIYQVDASHDYDPRPGLSKITAAVAAVNFADDPINPPDLRILEREIKSVKRGRAIVMPATASTFGHGSHTHAELWQRYLIGLLKRSR